MDLWLWWLHFFTACFSLLRFSTVFMVCLYCSFVVMFLSLAFVLFVCCIVRFSTVCLFFVVPATLFVVMVRLCCLSLCNVCLLFVLFMVK